MGRTEVGGERPESGDILRDELFSAPRAEFRQLLPYVSCRFPLPGKVNGIEGLNDSLGSRLTATLGFSSTTVTLLLAA